ncbi:MAG: c-type cytochrome [Rubrimonas sp.]|uniref:c-type cytochrome n=1 Tax=Rubrimonas sp. TaxID=2036015 RepID=UPI002FDDF39E
MRLALLAAAALSLSPMLADIAVADAADDAVKARRAYFTLLGANVGPLAAMAKGEVEYSAETATLHADNLGALSAVMIAPHFPEGTSKDDRFGDTRALPNIWTDFAGFAEKAEGLATAVAALQGVAGAGRAELGGGVQQVGAACKACHDDYRAADF